MKSRASVRVNDTSVTPQYFAKAFCKLLSPRNKCEVILFLFLFCVNTFAAPFYPYKIVKTFPHNVNSFTEGLVLENNILYESSGLIGKSVLYKLSFPELITLQKKTLSPQYFGEGITIYDNHIYQLTYQNHLGFIYDKTLNQIGTFHYDTEGWGLTTDNQQLIMSDGSDQLYFINPQTWKINYKVTVHEGEKKINYLNSLQYVKGVIFANVWMTDNIAIIDAKSGAVKGWLNLKPLEPDRKLYPYHDVLNGIAYNKKVGTLLVTGKYWPSMYEIKVEAKDLLAL